MSNYYVVWIPETKKQTNKKQKKKKEMSHSSFNTENRTNLKNRLFHPQQSTSSLSHLSCSLQGQVYHETGHSPLDSLHPTPRRQELTIQLTLHSFLCAGFSFHAPHSPWETLVLSGDGKASLKDWQIGLSMETTKWFYFCWLVDSQIQLKHYQ